MQCGNTAFNSTTWLLAGHFHLNVKQKSHKHELSDVLTHEVRKHLLMKLQKASLHFPEDPQRTSIYNRTIQNSVLGFHTIKCWSERLQQILKPSKKT
jgi:hypothetical protein